MRERYLMLLLLAGPLLVAGCKESADSFFSGRPSEMAMVHGRIIGGPPETMIELLRVPARFPDATEPQIANWQESAIAWWWHREKRQIMITSLEKISPEETNTLKNWVQVRDGHLSTEKEQALDEIEAAISAKESLSAPSSPQQPSAP